MAVPSAMKACYFGDSELRALSFRMPYAFPVRDRSGPAVRPHRQAAEETRRPFGSLTVQVFDAPSVGGCGVRGPRWSTRSTTLRGEAW